MSFRLKTILGVAVIQAVLLALLIWINLDFLRRSNEDRLIQHATSVATLFATTAKDPVLASDLATLESFVQEALKNPGVVYARVRGRRGVLAEAGDRQLLARSFTVDRRLDDVREGVYDSYALIEEGGILYGRVEIGLSTAGIARVMTDARRRTVGIAAAEMLLVALFSAVLGLYLTRQLKELTKGAEAIAAGNLGVQVPVRGHDDLARSALAFNNMSSMLRENEESRRVLLETALDCILVLDATGGVLEFAPDEAFGYRSRDMVGTKVTSSLIAERDYAPFRAAIQAYFDTGMLPLSGRRMEIAAMHADGSGFPVEISINVYPTQGRPRFVAFLRDITARKRAEADLRLAANVFRHASEGIMITDLDARILDVNRTFTAITGYTKEEVLGQTPRLLRSGRHPTEFYRAMWESLLRDGFWKGEIWNRKKDGGIYAEMLNIATVTTADGEPHQYVALFSDITQMKNHQHRMERMAHYDALTQLPNRVLLDDRMHQAIARARRTGTLLALAYLDLDGFKPVNDGLGHEAGDLLLQEMAKRLTGCVRASDTVARLGGDEFVLLLGDFGSVETGEKTLERILDTISRPFHIFDREVDVSASIGVTVYPLDDATPDTLLRHADLAMYEAKRAGRSRFHLFAWNDAPGLTAVSDS